jgi:hypothetical protein
LRNKEPAEKIDSMIAQVRALPLRKGASVLLVDDPFGTDEYTPLFIFQLVKHDKRLAVRRTKMDPGLAAHTEDFDLVLRYPRT